MQLSLQDLARSGPYSLRLLQTSCDAGEIANLRDLMTLVTASSDLTKPPKGNSLKEVIQPHLPVRLPCYDFTPLTGHSFGASVPYGFGQRLREQQIQVM